MNLLFQGIDANLSSLETINLDSIFSEVVVDKDNKKRFAAAVEEEMARQFLRQLSYDAIFCSGKPEETEDGPVFLFETENFRSGNDLFTYKVDRTGLIKVFETDELHRMEDSDGKYHVKPILNLSLVGEMQYNDVLPFWGIVSMSPNSKLIPVLRKSFNIMDQLFDKPSLGLFFSNFFAQGPYVDQVQEVPWYSNPQARAIDCCDKTLKGYQYETGGRLHLIDIGRASRGIPKRMINNQRKERENQRNPSGMSKYARKFANRFV